MVQNGHDFLAIVDHSRVARFLNVIAVESTAMMIQVYTDVIICPSTGRGHSGFLVQAVD